MNKRILLAVIAMVIAAASPTTALAKKDKDKADRGSDKAAADGMAHFRHHRHRHHRRHHHHHHHHHLHRRELIPG